ESFGQSYPRQGGEGQRDNDGAPMREVDFEIAFPGSANERERLSAPDALWTYLVRSKIETIANFFKHAFESSLAQLNIAAHTYSSQSHRTLNCKCVLTPITPHPQHQ